MITIAHPEQSSGELKNNDYTYFRRDKACSCCDQCLPFQVTKLNNFLQENLTMC